VDSEVEEEDDEIEPEQEGSDDQDGIEDDSLRLINTRLIA